MLTQRDLDEIENLIDRKLDEKFDEKFGLLPTKQEFFSKMDEVMAELQALREEHEVSGGRTTDHEDRLENLERIHPHGKHASV